MWIEVLLLLLLLFFLLYWYVTKDYDYFAKRGIPFVQGRFPLGSVAMDLVTRKRAFVDIQREQYNR
jgi:hypothetical protein